MSEIETKIKNDKNDSPFNHCRACQHFLRVNKTIYDVLNRQGFCILGQLQGDYGLYISSSCGRGCMGFIFSNNNHAISNAEDELSQELTDYIHSLRDSRTKHHKLIKPVNDALITYIKATKNKTAEGGDWLIAMTALRKIATDHFKKQNRQKYIDIFNMVSLKKTDYLSFLSHVSVRVHDKFCPCNCIKTKEADI